MVEAISDKLPLGAQAPDFSLPDSGGKQWRLSDFSDRRALVVVFICNHCPYVKHLKGALADFAAEFARKGAGLVAINSNDWTAYPEDSPAKMAEDATRYRYPFPYLVDESQDVAKAYGAVCTPDFFLFDAERRLVYRGQFDDSRPGKGEPTGADLRKAVEAVLAGRKPEGEQKPSVGCSIKWKA